MPTIKCQHFKLPNKTTMSLVILTNIFLVPAFRLVLIPIRLFSSFFYWNDYFVDRKEVRIKIVLLALSAFSQSLKNLMLKSIATLSMDTANSRQTESTTTNRKKPQLLKRNHTYLHHNANWMEFSRSSCFSFCYGSNYERLCNKNAKRKNNSRDSVQVFRIGCRSDVFVQFQDKAYSNLKFVSVIDNRIRRSSTSRLVQFLFFGW